MSRNPARQELARSFGSTEILAERGDTAFEAVRELTIIQRRGEAEVATATGGSSAVQVRGLARSGANEARR
jgi:hypothetical protein